MDGPFKTNTVSKTGRPFKNVQCWKLRCTSVHEFPHEGTHRAGQYKQPNFGSSSRASTRIDRSNPSSVWLKKQNILTHSGLINMGRTGKDKKHVLVVPVCLHGHFIMQYMHAVDLAKRGVTITFLCLEREMALLKTFEELEGLDFNLVGYKDFGSDMFVPSGNEVLDILEFVTTSKARFQQVLDKLVADKKAGLPGPTCLMADIFLTWAFDAAKDLDISFFSFWCGGATYVRMLQAQVPLFADGTLTIKEGPGGSPYLEPFEGHLNIQGLPPLEYRDMIHPHPMDTKNVAMDTYLAIGTNINRADGVIVNSVYDLESPQIDAIRQIWKESSLPKIPKLYLAGPISNAATFKDRSLQNLKSSGYTLKWLDGRPPLSVVFICLGTIARLSPPQVEELAMALEASEQSFLWVVSRGVADSIPPGFEARTKEKGLVVSGWVPQLQILAHSALGGFVTHCGWNSIIESISAGVPMAAWPQMPIDQFQNCRHMVDALKIAVEVRSDDTISSATGKATLSTATSPKKYVGLEKAVRLLLSEEGIAMRARVQELKKSIEAALADGGDGPNAMLNNEIDSIP